jgi:hypothetical protein
MTLLQRSFTAPIALVVLLGSAASQAQTRAITTPKQQFAHEIGADYQLPNYRQLTEYWHKLDRESDRLTVVDIGKTAEGRSQLMAVITSPENHKRLTRYREISRHLALADVSEDMAQTLAKDGRAVVWIDGGLHATEVLGAQQLMETVYQLVSRSDAETTRILNDVVILAVHANPDGHDLVADWYMREKDPQKRSTSNVPRLYQKYIGHDNNRDFYMSAQPESTNMNRVLYHEWFPQILYNHHQTGPAGAVMFAPPFRDPFNYVFDPLVPAQLDMVGAAMHARFEAEGKPGVVTRRAANYSTWWNGGLRTTVYFHNMIGLLTETIGNPTPIDIPFVPDRLLPDSNQFFPITPQRWHFRQSIDYSVTANYAVLDYASRYRETLLRNSYQMGRNAIGRGSRDHWTNYPHRIEMVKAAAKNDVEPSIQGRRGGRRSSTVPTKYFELLRDPKLRDPRGYVVPADQPDFLTATKFANALIKTGITIHRATAAFSVGGRNYPAGSYVVKTAQPFRAHVLDMFEPQDHPQDMQYPGGPPIAPYDSAGWTLAFQMGVKFDRILDGFDGPFEKISGFATPPAGRVAPATAAGGFVLSHQVNDSVIAVNRLLAADQEIYWLNDAKAAGFYVPAKGNAEAILKTAVADFGLHINATARPAGDATRLRKPRIGLWDQYGGSMPSGWTRWILEQYEFPFEVVYPQTLDAGNLSAKYDVLVFPDGAIPVRAAAGERPQSDGDSAQSSSTRQPTRDSVPAEYRARLGRVTADKTIPQLRRFLEDGGTILTIGSSTNLAYHLDLPVSSHLVEHTAAGIRALPNDKFFVPGSILRARVDPASPVARGSADALDVFFDASPVFRLDPDAAQRGVRTVAWYDGQKPLRSGWAWGQAYLDGGAAIVDAAVGRGRLFLFGPEIAFRAQPHGTFKFLFNGIYLGATSNGRGTTTEQ